MSVCVHFRRGGLAFMPVSHIPISSSCLCIGQNNALKVSVVVQGYLFHMDNPFKDWPNAFEEGLQKSREGDLNSAVLLLEAAILQDPHDSEVRSFSKILGLFLGLCIGS